MGVYELQPLNTPGMHWHHPERHQMLAAAYDPSRDLSPNLPLPSTCQEGGGPALMSCAAAFKTEPDSYEHPGLTHGCRDCRDCGHFDPREEEYRKSCRQEGESAYRERRGEPLYPPLEPPLKQEPPPPSGGRGGGGTSPEDDDVTCAGCGRRISDRFYLFAVERRWHSSCLQCCHCRRVLDGEITCFARDGNIYCKNDYYKLFGSSNPKRCGRCLATISASEMVMRAREMVYHVHCFSCTVCQCLLNKGDTFGMRDGHVFCRLHYQELPPAPPPDDRLPYPVNPVDLHFHPRLTPPLPTTPPHPHQHPHPDQVKVATSFFNGTPTPRQKGRPRKRKPKDLEAMTANLDLNAESYLDVAFGPGTPGMGGGNGSHHQRTKRMRTSFKHHQLRTMKSYFAINHNPDAKDLKQLSQKTGLPKRVLQVWFQNARAKWRRMMLKQESGGGGKGGDKCDGSGASMDGAYHLPPHGSPQHYLSPSPLECSS